jgi:transcriptional regulator with XRE-family HTH domain
MVGADVKAWRARTGYSQKELQLELGLRSRTSISNLENQARPISRSVELALAALEIAPLLRLTDGKEGRSKRLISYPAISETEAREFYNQWKTGKFASEVSKIDEQKSTT